MTGIYNKPWARFAHGCPLPQLDHDTDVADDDRDEGEHELGDVGEASVDEFVGLFPGLLADHLTGGGVLDQLHEQGVAVTVQ